MNEKTETRTTEETNVSIVDNGDAASQSQSDVEVNVEKSVEKTVEQTETEAAVERTGDTQVNVSVENHIPAAATIQSTPHIDPNKNYEAAQPIVDSLS